MALKPSLVKTPNGKINQLREDDLAFHNWYRFVLSYPPHLVKHYLDQFQLNINKTVLDPFAGTGTTLVEAKLNGFPSVGIEANPFAHFASSVKINWDIDVDDFYIAALEIAEVTAKEVNRKEKTLLEFTSVQGALLIRDSISPLILHKTLLLKKNIRKYKDKSFYSHLLLALAKSTTFSVSNLRFGPEIGIGKIKDDAEVVKAWMNEIEHMARDIKKIHRERASSASSLALCGDSRLIDSLLEPNSIDAVITSPPYPNEKDYTRTTRLETVLLDFASTKAELRALKKNLVRSNTRGVYKEDNDAAWGRQVPEIEIIANNIEQRRIELNKTSGFERLYPKVTREYFGGMARHLESLKTVLRPGARLAYVVGDQASYLRVMIRTGQLLAKIAEGLGYRLVSIDLFRERFASSTKAYLREEVVVLEWEGN